MHTNSMKRNGIKTLGKSLALHDQYEAWHACRAMFMTSVWMNSMNVKMPHRISIICMPAGGKARSVPACRTHSMRVCQPG